MGRIVSARGAATRPAAARRRGLRVWVCCLGLALLPALTGCAWLSAHQSRLALRPTPGRPANMPADDQLFKPGDLRFLVPVPAAATSASTAPERPDQLALWWLPHADPQAPTLLYLHGTFRNLYPNLTKINALREAGFSVVAVDYRGWGESTSIVPTEDSITADALLAWAEMQRRQPDPRKRVIFGHSMGGAVAVRLASGLHGGYHPAPDYGALALESTFTRLPDVAAEAGFWGRVAAFVTTLEFNSLTRIKTIDAPILMLHGTADNTVPVAVGRRLRDAAPPGVRWVEVPGGTHSRLHSEVPELYAQAFKDLIQTLAAPRTAAPEPTKP